MMPRAKIEKRSSAPPENIFAHPNRVPGAASKSEASACPSIPGVGTATPIRYTASMKAVKSSRRRNSGMRDAPEKPSSIAGLAARATGINLTARPHDLWSGGLLCQLGRASRLGNLVARALRERIGAHRQFIVQIPVAQDFDLESRLGEVFPDQCRNIDRSAIGEIRQLLQVDDDEFVATLLVLKQTAKSALRDAPLQRHLPAFISRRRIATGARALALVSAAGSLAEARADSASATDMLRGRSLGGFQVTEVHLNRYSLTSTTICCRRRIMPSTCGLRLMVLSLPILCRPSPRTVSRTRRLVLMTLPTSRIFIMSDM